MLLRIKENMRLSTKGSTKDLINKLSILIGSKHFSLGIFQNYLVFIFITAKNTFQWQYSD